MTYGRFRVRIKEQNEDRQFIVLLKMAVPEAKLFMDKQSGRQMPDGNLSVRHCASSSIL